MNYYTYVNRDGKHVGEVHVEVPDGAQRRLMGGGYQMGCGKTMHTLMEADGLALWMHAEMPEGIPPCMNGCFNSSPDEMASAKLNALAQAVRDKYGPPMTATYGYFGHTIDLIVGPRPALRSNHASRCACCRLARMRRHRLTVAHRQAREART